MSPALIVLVAAVVFVVVCSWVRAGRRADEVAARQYVELVDPDADPCHLCDGLGVVAGGLCPLCDNVPHPAADLRRSQYEGRPW